MTNQIIQIDREEIVETLNELQLNSGSLSSLTRLYEEMRADSESGECRHYIDAVSLGALQRGIIALAMAVDQSIFKLDCRVRDEKLVPIRASGE
ncbi:hypothetical protein [Marinobacter salsuginis]|uniref:hypothetical protein n=1 Tax=Marinobacter salsuginis TaxID=418719 RepID=UPI00273EF39A|nr:hypothetical protein [Marinobacter salsuginis]